MKYLLKKSTLFSIAFLTCYGTAIGAPQTKASMNAQVVKANAFMKAGKSADAIKILKPMISDLPRHGLLALSKAYHAQKNYLEETRTLESAFAQNDKDYYIQTLLGGCYLANHELEKAADNFSAAKDLKGDYMPAYLGLAKTYEAKGQLDDARQIFNDMVQSFGSKKFFFNEICRLYAVEGSMQEGIMACQRATSFDSANPGNHITLGHMLIENDQSQRGEMIILKAARQFKRSEAAQLAAASIRFKHQQWKDAADIYMQATIANPRSDEGYLGWGKSLFQMQKYPEAKVAIIKACTINKKYLGDLKNAIAELRQKDKSLLATQYEEGLGRCGD